jgi:hypothetical protein
MADVATTIDGYFAVWNETDPTRRRDLIARTWTEDASYLDPLLASDGADGIDAMVAAVQEQFPGHTFRLTGPIDSHHDRIRFLWELAGPNGDGPVIAGLDVGVIAPDGRLRSITGFLDQVPA